MAAGTPSGSSWSGAWLTSGVKDLSLSGTPASFVRCVLAPHSTAADEQLAQRDLTRTDPEVVRRFGKGTRYDLKVRRDYRLSAAVYALKSCLTATLLSPDCDQGRPGYRQVVAAEAVARRRFFTHLCAKARRTGSGGTLPS